MISHIVSISCVLLSSLAIYQFYNRYHCSFDFMEKSFFQITKSLHSESKNERSPFLVCKKLALLRRANQQYRTKHYGWKKEINLKLEKSLVDE